MATMDTIGPKIWIMPGIELRLFYRDDVSSLFKAVKENLAHLSEWKVWYEKLMSKREVQVFIDANYRQTVELLSPEQELINHPGFQCGIFAEDGTVLGMVGFQGLNLRNHIAAIGYWLVESAQGKGIMTLAVQKLIEYGWDVLGIHRYEIQVWVGNKRSSSVAERLGFVKESILKEIEYRNGEYLDHYLYRLIPSDLKNTTP
jgi:ribosomal-protein-serine acetyltransferase